MALADVVKEGRQRMGMSQRAFGAHAGIHPTIIHRVEAGRHADGLRDDNMTKLAQALGLTVEMLRVRAGIVDPEWEAEQARRWTVRDAVDADPNLTDRQREALLAVYCSFVPCGSDESS